MFGQTFDPHDAAIIGLLIVLEGVLSIDNALVLGLLAKRLPKHQQKRALTYGLVGAFVFRLIAIALASLLLEWWVVKLLGGAYLIYVAIKHFFFEDRPPAQPSEVPDPEPEPALVHAGSGPTCSAEREPADPGRSPAQRAAGGAVAAVTRHARFWPTVVVIELTDIAFAIDSILAAIALVSDVPHDPTETHPKLWVVISGGFIGVVLMRFAAVIFIRLLDRFPRFETAAYLLVTVIGFKLIADWWLNKPPADWPTGKAFHGPADFHNLDSPAFWIFWIAMLACFAIGFIPRRERASPIRG